MVKVLLVYMNLIFLFSPMIGWGQEADYVIEKLLDKQGLITSQSGWFITSEHISSTSKIHHIY